MYELPESVAAECIDCEESCLLSPYKYNLHRAEPCVSNQSGAFIAGGRHDFIMRESRDFLLMSHREILSIYTVSPKKGWIVVKKLL